MPSPFPGMNPYLEQPAVWQDFHQTFLALLRRVLRELVHSDYYIKVEEQLYIHELPADERRLLGKGDMTVTSARPRSSAGTAAGAVLEAPVYGRISSAVEIERHAFLEIRDRQQHELITVLELLSPSNKKSGADREQYLAKRREILASSVHLVELDLLRGGPRMPVEDRPDCEYCVLVSHAEQRPRVGIWPLRLREPLPTIPIPLRSPSPDARIDLQQALHRHYDESGYGDYIYLTPPQPPLHPTDAAWAAQFVPQPGSVSGNGA
jgi:hypothetical protein